VSKLCAVWLVVLIVLPFTAPFATFQFDAVSQSDVYETPSKELKDTGKAAKLGTPGAWPLHVVLPAAAAFVPYGHVRSPIEPLALRQTILRI